jgi:hypothetical chaperone protein
VVACARECVRRAGSQRQRIDAIYLTGGSSALMTLQDRLKAHIPGVPLVQGDLFGGVAAGLAYAAQQRAGHGFAPQAHAHRLGGLTPAQLDE